MRLKKEEPQKERREKSKKEVIAWEAAGFALFILAFADLLIPIALGDRADDYGWLILVVFFVLMIGSVVVLVYIFPDAAVLDLKKGIKKYNARELTRLSHAGKQEVLETFRRHKFKETDLGFYRKKIFSFTQDSVCYYVALTDAENVEKAWEKTAKQLETIQEKAKCVCLLVFLYKAQPTEQDQKVVRERAAWLLANEKVLPEAQGFNMVPILVDTITGEGMYLSENHGITVYAHGSRLLKKYIR